MIITKLPHILIHASQKLFHLYLFLYFVGTKRLQQKAPAHSRSYCIARIWGRQGTGCNTATWNERDIRYGGQPKYARYAVGT